jgi:hypothetical protein
MSLSHLIGILGIIYTANPVATRGSLTKLSSYGSKLVYANGRTIVVCRSRTNVPPIALKLMFS